MEGGTQPTKQKRDADLAMKRRRAAVIARYAQSATEQLVTKLRETLNCTILTVGEEGVSADYETARTRAWNKDARGFPAVIVRVKTAPDVATVVRFCSANDIHPAIASGCHSARHMMDNAFVIDFHEMNAIEFDEETQRISGESGCTIDRIDDTLKPHGLAVPMGTYPGTGIAGLTLSGGNGFLSRMYGFTVDNLVAVDAVLPSGEIIHATGDNEYRDFLWACKGGGGNFGIVTKFHYQAHRMPSGGLVGKYETRYEASTSAEIASLLKGLDIHSTQAPESVNFLSSLMCGGGTATVFWCYTADGLVRGDKTTPQPLARASRLEGLAKTLDEYDVVNYHSEMQYMLTPYQVSDYWYQAVVAMQELTDDVVDTIAHYMQTEIPNKLSGCILFPTWGKSRGEYAIYGGKSRYWIIVEGRWSEDDGLQGRRKVQQWCRNFVAKMNSLKETHGTAHDLGMAVDTDDKADCGSDGVAENIFQETLPKLRAIKTKYDPHNLLSQNRNIAPNVSDKSRGSVEGTRQQH